MRVTLPLDSLAVRLGFLCAMRLPASNTTIGLMLGCVLLLWLNKKASNPYRDLTDTMLITWNAQLGERRALFLYALLAILYVVQTCICLTRH